MWASLVALWVKNPPANAGDSGLIPGSGRSPEERNIKLFQYSCLGNPMDRGAPWATVHGFAKTHHAHTCAKCVCLCICLHEVVVSIIIPAVNPWVSLNGNSFFSGENNFFFNLGRFWGWVKEEGIRKGWWASTPFYCGAAASHETHPVHRRARMSGGGRQGP